MVLVAAFRPVPVEPFHLQSSDLCHLNTYPPFFRSKILCPTGVLIIAGMCDLKEVK